MSPASRGSRRLDLTCRWNTLPLAAVLLLLAFPAPAQLARDSSTDWLASAGSESERYLRTLQLIDKVPATPWSIRPFSSRALRRIAPADTGHPWAGRLDVRPRGRMWIRALQPEVGGVFNTLFPYGMSDGPVWAGRGLTTIASAGVHGEVGPLEFRLAPQVFRAENSAFPLVPNGQTGPPAFGVGRIPQYIDLPQRFGDRPYQRLDPGQSHVALNALHLTLGASTANEYWGPAIESPFLLGTNASGFAHLFAGTDGPVSLGPVTVGMRVIAGLLEQSGYSPAPFSGRRRSLAGLVGVVGVRQLPNLEVGAARIFEGIYPDSGVGLGDILRPLVEGVLKGALRNGPGDDAQNQILSVFARWAFPSSGVEVYGELGREDHSYDLRDLILEPDHDFSYMFGLQRAWRRPHGSVLVFRGELLNTAISHLAQVRLQAPPYEHTPIVQGHTQLGQVLGAPAGYAGGTTMVSVESVAPAGRRSFTWRRILREPPPSPSSVRDVMHAFTLDWLVLRRRVDLTPELTAVYNLNRNASYDAVNFRVALLGRAHW